MSRSSRADSPFAGLAVPAEVKVNRQVLAEPSADLASHTWAALADGTPLVTQATRGAGRVVLFHVTANADWSNLPLSGLFVDMLRRLVALSAGVATTCRQHGAGAGRNAGRLWPAVGAAAGGDRPARQRDRRDRRLATPPARSVWSGEWQARTESWRQPAGA